MNKTKIKKFFSIIAFAAFAAALCYFGIKYFDEIYAIIMLPEARNRFIDFVHESGFVGILAFMGLQLLQIIVAIIPGEPIELIAGGLYGTWLGLLFCLAGVFIGTALIYGAVKLLGAKQADEKVLHKYRFLKDKSRVHLLLFLLFFIPGTPKDMLTYIGPFLPVKPLAFLLISTFARIPSIITSTYAGANLVQGRLTHVIVVFLITGALALIGILTQDKLIAFFNKVKTGIIKKEK